MLKYIRKINLKKYRAWIAVFVMFMSVVIFLRSPFVSNRLKMEILAGLQRATGKQVITQKIYVNLIPFFVGFNDMRAFNEDGSKIADIQQVKAYIDPFKLLIRTMDIDRVVISDADVYLTDTQIEDMKARYSGKDGDSGGGGLFKVSLGKVVLQGTDIEYKDAMGRDISSYGTDAELSLNRKALTLEYDSKSIKVAGLNEAAGIPDMDFGLSFIARKKDDLLELDKFEFQRRGTVVAGQGVIAPLTGAPWSRFELRLDAKLVVDSLRDLLDLKSDTTGTVNAKGTVTYDVNTEGYVVDFGVNGDMYLESLMEIVMRNHPNPYLAGYMEFDGKLKGPVTDLVGVADASVTGGHFYGVDLAKGKCKVDYKDHKLNFSNGKADIYNGKADVYVSVTIPGGAPYTVDVDFRSTDSGPLFNLIGIGAFGFSSGKVTGEFHTDGMELAPRGKALFVSEGSGDLPTSRIKRLEGVYDTDEQQRLHLRNFKVDTAKSNVVFDGFIGLHSHELSFDGALATSDVSDLLVPSFPDMDGELRFKGKVSGTTKEPRLAGRATYKGLGIRKYGIGDGEMDFVYTNDRFDVIAASASLGSSTHLVSGKIDFPAAKHLFDLESAQYDLSAAIVSSDVGSLINAVTGQDVEVSGQFDSYVTVKGAKTAPVIEGKLYAYNTEAYGRMINKADMSIKFKDGWLELGNVDAVSGTSSVQGEFKVSTEGSFAFKARSERAMLNLAFRDRIPVDYAIRLNAEGDGTFKSPRIHLLGDLTEGRYGLRPVGGGSIDLTLEDDELKAKAMLLDGKVSAVGSALLGANYPWDLDMRLEFDRYEYLLKQYIVNAPSDLTIGAEGSILAWGNRSDYNAKVDLSKLNVFMFESGYSNMSDVIFEVRERSVKIDQFAMHSGTATFDAKGSVGFDGQMDLRLKGGSSLMPLRMISSKVEIEKGDAEFDIALTGTFEEPNIEGRVKVMDTTVSFPGMVQKLSGINGSIVFADNRASIESLRANIGGGTVDATGNVDYEGFEVQTVNIETTIRDVSAYLTKGFVANIDGDILFAGTAESQELLGELHLNRARYDKRIDWKSWLLSGARALQPSEKAAWMERVGLNVRLTGSQGIRVDNNLARADLRLDVFARGTLASPVLYGKIESDEGKVYFRNSEFDIIKATADYSDIDISGPYIDIQARTSVKGYRIWLSLEGRADQMDLTLTSDPPLEDVDILALLTLGDYGENLSGLEGGISAAEATSFLTGKIQDVVEERFKIITGIDRFQIDPYVSRTTSTVTPRVTLSKRLAGESVFVTYSSTLDAVAEQEVKIEYLLNENVSILAGQDYTGSMGGDVKIRFSFK